MYSHHPHLPLCQPDRVISEEVEDEAALAACLMFADQHRMLVEPACGASLSAVYSGLLTDRLASLPAGPVVVVVCGGNIVNTDLSLQWKHQLAV